MGFQSRSFMVNLIEYLLGSNKNEPVATNPPPKPPKPPSAPEPKWVEPVEGVDYDKIFIPLPTPLKTGDIIRVAGTLARDAKIFGVSLMDSSDLPRIVPYQYKAYLKEGRGVFNLENEGALDEEASNESLRLPNSNDFTVDVKISEKFFETRLNNTSWKKHRDSSSVFANQMEIWNGKGNVIKTMAFIFQDTNTLKDRMLVLIPLTPKAGDSVSLSGVIADDAEKFSVSLVESLNSEGLPFISPYYFETNFDEEEAKARFDMPLLRKGDPFTMKITMYSDSFVTSLNDDVWRRSCPSDNPAKVIEISSGLKKLNDVSINYTN